MQCKHFREQVCEVLWLMMKNLWKRQYILLGVGGGHAPRMAPIHPLDQPLICYCSVMQYEHLSV